MFAGETVAALAGYATVFPTFDFETYSEAGFVWHGDVRKWKELPGLSSQKRGLSGVGVRNYVEHPSFELICLTYDLKDGKGPRFWKHGQPVPQDLFNHITSGGLIEAHNSGFEFQVWNYHCAIVLGWPALRLEQMRCSMSKARASAYPGGLDPLGDVLDLKNKKDAAGKALIKKFTVPRNPTKTDPRTRIRCDDDPQGPQFYSYNVQDVLAECEASARIPDLNPVELEVWLADQRINDRGLQVDMVAVENCIAIVEQAYEKYNAELRGITNGIEASELAQLQAWLAGRGVHLYDMTEESIDTTIKQLRDEVKAGAMHRAVDVRVLELRQMLGSASVKKLFAIRAQADSRGRLHDLYSYYASRTGRWTGNGPQPQNLYKGKYDTLEAVEHALSIIASRVLEYVEYELGDALEAVNGCLRSMFIAAPGHDLIWSDFSAIEGVVAAAISGCEWRLDVFRTHGMIYEASAAKITGEGFEAFVKHRVDSGGVPVYDSAGTLQSITGGKHHKMRNKIGKFAELASGFGGWINAWLNFGAGEFLTEPEIKDGILKWRAASPELPEMWGGQSRGRFDWARPELYGLEGAAISAVLNPGQAFGHRCIAFQMQGDVLYMRLPSGRLLTYHAPRLAPSQRPYANAWEYELTFSGYNTNPMKGAVGWIRMKLYGGLIFENAVQAIARDLQAWAILNAERAGYRVVLHTHDEVCCEVPEGWGSVEELERLMMAVPSWAQGWPVKAKGGIRSKRYGKFE